MAQKQWFTYLSGALILSLIFLTSSCRKDFSTAASNGQLRFSTDTVFLDTVFSTIGSSTYRMTVYNDRDQAITIPEIALGEGQNSHYRLNVDGMPGKNFKKVDILAHDSIFIFIETTVDIQEFGQHYNHYLYTDQIQFDIGIDQQAVELVTLVKDAHFLYPEKYNDGNTEKLTIGEDAEGNPIKISGFFLDDNELHFTDEKPYVIYGYAAVPPQKTLTIDAGARIHFHSNGGIIVANQASLHVNGAPSNDPELLENQVIFQGDRLEPDFENRAGQWQTIWLTKGSTDNIITYATIKNGTVGIRIDATDGSGNPTLQISNTQIYNCSTVGLWATTSRIIGKNLAINNCGQAALYLSLGGHYQFYNSTFVNYWNRGYRNFPAVLISNQYQTSESILVADLQKASFHNCIIYGNQNIELLFNKSDQALFNYNIENSLIRFNDQYNYYGDSPLYDFTNTTHFQANVLNMSPEFKDASTNDLRISDASAANGLANPSTATTTDITGRSRQADPDSGAYESTVFDESN